MASTEASDVLYPGSKEYNLFVQNLLSGNSSQDLPVSQPMQESEVQNLQNEFDKEMFLIAVREYQCLWNTSHPLYKNRTVKNNAWKALAVHFNQDSKYS